MWIWDKSYGALLSLLPIRSSIIDGISVISPLWCQGSSTSFLTKKTTTYQDLVRLTVRCLERRGASIRSRAAEFQWGIAALRWSASASWTWIHGSEPIHQVLRGIIKSDGLVPEIYSCWEQCQRWKLARWSLLFSHFFTSNYWIS